MSAKRDPENKKCNIYKNNNTKAKKISRSSTHQCNFSAQFQMVSRRLNSNCGGYSHQIVPGQTFLVPDNISDPCEVHILVSK